MPGSLKLYIAGVVTLSALALMVATFVFPADPRIALRLSIPGTLAAGRPSSLEMALGVGFWTVLALATSAFPVKLPRGTHQAVCRWFWLNWSGFGDRSVRRGVGGIAADAGRPPTIRSAEQTFDT